QLSGDESFQDLLTQVRETVLDGFAHQEVPFEQIVDALQVEHQLSHNALFQVMFILHNTPQETLTLPGLTITALEPEAQTARFDLSLDMYETATGLRGVIEYNTDLLKPSTIARFAQHFEQLLLAITTAPDQAIATLPLLTAAEQQQMLIDWNQTETNIPSACIHELIEQQASQNPDAIAVVFADQALSYQQLNERANQLAHYLQSLGITAGERLGICLERSLDLIVGLLAILKVGAVYIPLDPNYPVERSHFVATNAQLKGILIHDQTAHLRAQLQIDLNWIDLATDQAAIAQQPTANLGTQVKPDDLAYLIYTSGSTGQPKGVPIQHRSLVNLLQSMAQEPGITAEDTLLAVTTISFDIAALELFLPLLVGARLVIADSETTRNPEQLAQLLANQTATLMQATPATWRLLLDNGWLGQPTLKILCGGEALDSQLARRLLPCSAELWNLYGPTETTIWSAAVQITAATLTTVAAPIGRAIANTQLYVLNEALQPVPIGVAGELHIGGLGLSPGYWQRDDLTQERFVEVPPKSPLTPACAPARIDGGLSDFRTPWNRGAGGPWKLYKTGDLVRYREDGLLDYLGRRDYQVKLRGFRIELGEIEACLQQHSDVAQAVVVLQKPDSEQAQLAAYLALNPGLNSDATLSTRLRQHLSRYLPTYMVPATYTVLETLPLTPNGKVDRKALLNLEPTITQSDASDSKVESTPLTPVAEMIAGLWADVLHLDQNTLQGHHNFFELGGHSLLATQAIARVRQTFDIEIPLRELFEKPGLAEFSEAVEVALADGKQLALEPIPNVARTGQLTLSSAQQRQWVLAQLEPDNPFYTIPNAIRLTGELAISLLRQSLEIILDRHEILRTAFQRDETGQAVLEIQTEAVALAALLALPVTDLTSPLPSPSPTGEGLTEFEQIQQILHADLQQPFDLDQPPLLRLRLIKLGDRDHVVLLTLHHIVADAWSMGILVRELAMVYAAQQAQQTPAFKPLPIQYLDYAAWQQQRLRSADLTQQLDYWQQQLADAPHLLPLPT
ncbi:MAG: amino acid adenylation domain-containing protein, partial [Cyanobacteria bacterium P01_H01_bin.121]